MNEGPATAPFLSGGGSAGELIRSIDWSKNPLGAPSTWPRSLLVTVATILRSRHPMFLWWGPELVQFYNDAYTPSFGVGKHPAAMGQRGAECWTEIWPIIGPQIEGVMREGIPSWNEDALVPIFRNHRVEEVYWTYGYSAVLDDAGRIGGTLVICTETTSRVLGARRRDLLHAITAQESVSNPAAAMEHAFAQLANFREDVPFALAFDRRGTPTYVHGLSLDAVEELRRVCPRLITRTTLLDLFNRPLTAGPGPEPVTQALAVASRHGGYIVVGLGPRLVWDETYRTFVVTLVERIDAARDRAKIVEARAAATRERTTLYRHFAQAPFPIAVLQGPQHIVELANPLILAAWGKGPEAIGKPLEDAVPELRGQPFLGWLDDVFRTGTTFEGREQLAHLATGPNGEVEDVYANFTYAPLRDASGDVEGVLLSAFLVTEQVRARHDLERALARAESSESQFRYLVNNLPEPAWIARPDGSIEFYNQRWYDYTGTTFETVQGWGWDAVHAPEVLPHVIERWKHSLDSGASFEMEFPIRRADGAFRWFLTRANAVRDEHGRIVRWFGTNTDIDDARRERETAENLVRRAAEERARALHQAEQINRAKDEFLATMSHELRTPLNAMLGWASLLRTTPYDPARLARGLAVIERNAETQARLISDLLDMSRIISGKLRLSVKRIEIADALRAAVDVVAQAAESKGVQLVAKIQPEVGALVADPDRLQQIAWNLLTNAIKFTPAGGRVTIAARRIESQVEIQVEDTGAGIAANDLDSIFDRFKQVDGSITRSHGGLGLGLAIVRHLAEAHGGNVRARSHGLGTGSTFIVRLPVHAVITNEPFGTSPRPTDQPGSPIAEPKRLDGMRILIVDDEVDSVELLRILLEQAGALVEPASSARRALDAARAAPFDLVISDIGMPELDGYAFMQELRSRDEGARIPALALTAYARLEDRERALRAGYQDLVTKPVDAGLLFEKIELLVRRGP